VWAEPGEARRNCAVCLFVSSRGLPPTFKSPSCGEPGRQGFGAGGELAQQGSSSDCGYMAPPHVGRPHKSGGNWNGGQGWAPSPERNNWAPPADPHPHLAGGNWGGGKVRAQSTPRNNWAPPACRHVQHVAETGAGGTDGLYLFSATTGRRRLVEILCKPAATGGRRPEVGGHKAAAIRRGARAGVFLAAQRLGAAGWSRPS